jgi:hypothetical protein
LSDVLKPPSGSLEIVELPRPGRQPTSMAAATATLGEGRRRGSGIDVIALF